MAKKKRKKKKVVRKRKKVVKKPVKKQSTEPVVNKGSPSLQEIEQEVDNMMKEEKKGFFKRLFGK